MDGWMDTSMAIAMFENAGDATGRDNTTSTRDKLNIYNIYIYIYILSSLFVAVRWIDREAELSVAGHERTGQKLEAISFSRFCCPSVVETDAVVIIIYYI